MASPITCFGGDSADPLLDIEAAAKLAGRPVATMRRRLRFVISVPGTGNRKLYYASDVLSAMDGTHGQGGVAAV